jgi:predicted DNA-binding transcriptional regulator AlpA
MSEKIEVVSPLADPFIRPKKLAEATGKHPQSIYNAILAGELKAQRLGRRSLGIRTSEANRWISSLGEAA